MGAKTNLGILALAGLAVWGVAGARRVELKDLHGQVVVITGGSRGLGLCIARELAAQGCRLALVARDEHELKHARELLQLDYPELDVIAVACDVGSREDVDGMTALVLGRFGRIDGLVNVAGIIQVGPVEAMSLEDFDAIMRVNFYGALHAIYAMLPGMRERKAGFIVNIDSIGGQVAIPHLLPYHASKFALRGLSEGLAVELAKDGIEVLTVLPGLMRTGSPINALFKGNHALEFAWFGLNDTLPGLSMSAVKAAQRVVEGVRRGDREITLGVFARLGGLVHDVFPGATLAAFEVLERLLPAYEGPSNEAVRGRDVAAPEVQPLIKMIAWLGRHYNESPQK